MEKSTVHILWLGLLCGAISILYFFSLILHVPIGITVLLVVFSGYFLHLGLSKHITIHDSQFTPNHTSPLGKVAEGRKGLLVLTGGIAALTAASVFFARKYGDSDAITIWNFDALFLKDPQHWKALFKVEITHPDYPLLIPGNTAFFWRLLHTSSTTVPFVLSSLFYTLIPVLIYLEIYSKNIWISIIAFGVFLTNSYYLNLGLIQCADVPLSFYLLAAIVVMDHYQKAPSHHFILLCGALLGCCIWTKNEGLVMALLFGIFYAKTFLSKKNFKSFLIGFLPFAFTLFIFKTFYAPANDLVSGQHAVPWQNILDAGRYKTIFSFFGEKMIYQFPVPTVAIVGYIVFNLLWKKSFSKNFWLLCSIMAAYVLVYIYTPYNLEWHVSTSIGRLMMQLMPAMIYVVATAFLQVRFKVAKQ